MTASEAKKILLEGNARFVSGKSDRKDMGMGRRTWLSEHGQKPFALVVGCIGSRVPPELIFDRGLGEILVVRTAGQVLDEAGLGSIEFAAEHLGVALIVVLGHEKCGAVAAAVSGGTARGCLKAVTDKIRQSLERVAGSADLYTACEDENIRAAVEEIRQNEVVARLVKDGRTEVVGAKYGLTSGFVRFFD